MRRLMLTALLLCLALPTLALIEGEAVPPILDTKLLPGFHMLNSEVFAVVSDEDFAREHPRARGLLKKTRSIAEIYESWADMEPRAFRDLADSGNLRDKPIRVVNVQRYVLEDAADARRFVHFFFRLRGDPQHEWLPGTPRGRTLGDASWYHQWKLKEGSDPVTIEYNRYVSAKNEGGIDCVILKNSVAARLDVGTYGLNRVDMAFCESVASAVASRL